MIESPFFAQFLKVSNFYTVISIVLLVVAIFVLKSLKDKKVSFSKRMIIALIIGLVLGIGIDLVGSQNPLYLEHARGEIAVWYDLIGSGFLKLVQLLKW
jgi:L-cystine uptake protein TcyP (sodium:dicarboxylate symporter family)